jgi:hypothetical protein
MRGVLLGGAAGAVRPHAAAAARGARHPRRLQAGCAASAGALLCYPRLSDRVHRSQHRWRERRQRQPSGWQVGLCGPALGRGQRQGGRPPRRQKRSGRPVRFKCRWKGRRAGSHRIFGVVVAVAAAAVRQAPSQQLRPCAGVARCTRGGTVVAGSAQQCHCRRITCSRSCRGSGLGPVTSGDSGQRCNYLLLRTLHAPAGAIFRLNRPRCRLPPCAPGARRRQGCSCG